MIAIALSQQIAALFLMMAAGFILVKVGVVKSEDSKPISTVIVYLIVPARFRSNIPLRFGTGSCYRWVRRC